MRRYKISKNKKVKSNLIGSYLKKCREKNEFTLDDIKNMVGMSRANVCQIESGIKVSHDVRCWITLCKLYNVNPSKIFNLYMKGKYYEW